MCYRNVVHVPGAVPESYAYATLGASIKEGRRRGETLARAQHRRSRCPDRGESSWHGMGSVRRLLSAFTNPDIIADLDAFCAVGHGRVLKTLKSVEGMFFVPAILVYGSTDEMENVEKVEVDPGGKAA